MLKILQQILQDFYRLSDHFVKTRYYKVNYFCENSVFGNIYLFKINNKNTRKRREICSKLTVETPKRNC